MRDTPLWCVDHSSSSFSLYQILLCKKDTDFAQFIMIEFSLSQRPLPYSASGDLYAQPWQAYLSYHNHLPLLLMLLITYWKGQRLHTEYISSCNILKASKCFSLMYWEGRMRDWSVSEQTGKTPLLLWHSFSMSLHIQPWTCCVTEHDLEVLIFLYTLPGSHRYRELHRLDCKALVNRRWLF